MRGNKYLILVVLSSFLAGFAQTGDKSVDTNKSVMTVHVYKSGMFSAFGHEHEISAPIISGSFNEQKPSANLRVDARRMQVMDKDVSDKDREKIQATMLGPEVLDSERFSEISFKSTSVSRLGDGRWLVLGDMTLHGQTRPVKVQVQGQSGHYSGSSELKQKDFGIQPVSVGGGTVKVKNELKVAFEIWSKE
jgi:polyisoprenoid-binding protein YceI